MVEAGDLAEVHQKVGCVGFGQVSERSSEGYVRLLGQQILLTAHDRQPLLELLGGAPERCPDLGIEVLSALPPPLEQKGRQPVEPCELLGSQVRVLLREPFECDFGFASPSGRALNGAKPLSLLGPHGTMELRAVRSQQAAEAPNGNPEIMKGLAVEPIVEPALCGLRGGQALERQPSRGFLVAAIEEIVGQRAATFRLPMVENGRRLGGRLRLV